jgi:hypothetical protein
MAMSIQVNGHAFYIHKFISNPLTMEACLRYNVDQVDMYIMHTDLMVASECLPISESTYGLVCMVPNFLDLCEHVQAKVALRLQNMAKNQSEVEVGYFLGSLYTPGELKFPLAGSLGCTGALHLGLHLLEKHYGTPVQVMSILFIYDQQKLQQRVKENQTVADESILEYCEQQHPQLSMPKQSSDCDNWRECRHQIGTKCNPEKAQCS